MHSPSKPLHVLHISHGVNTGLAHCVADYVKHQISHGVRVSVACPGGRLATMSSDVGAKVLRWDATRTPSKATASEAVALRKIIQTVQPDVIHLHCAKAGFVGRSVVRGSIPTVFSPHAWSFLAADGAYQRMVREWERFATRWTNVTVCVSHAEKETGRRHGVRGRVCVLPNTVDYRPIDALTGTYRGEIRNGLHIAAGTPIAVVVARLCRQKGQDLAVQIWPRVREEVPSAELVIIGDGPEREQLEERAAGVAGLRFLGTLSREETLRWMYASDVVLCPSRWEGMSLVPIEAMALGRAVVAADVDGMRESLVDGAGFLIQPEDTSALAEVTTKLLANPSEAFDAGQLAQIHAQKIRAENTVPPGERLVELYRELAAKNA